MAKMLTIQDFFRMFPDDDACLKHLFDLRFGPDYACPKCGVIGTFHRLKNMPAYTCNCGHHVHPMAATPFLRTRTPLQKWFYAMFIFTTTRNGVAAKELQRQLGVTYKCAWRIARELRIYMAWVDGDAPLGGSEPGAKPVEMDKGFIGGKDKIGFDDKAVVLGMVERGGDAMAKVIPGKDWHSVNTAMRDNVKQGSMVYTDDAPVFRSLPNLGYGHDAVNHKAKEWVRGDVHTNTVEGFWAMVKRTIAGTHIWVSPKHLSTYLGEIEFRWNLRQHPEAMFPLLLAAFRRP